MTDIKADLLPEGLRDRLPPHAQSTSRLVRDVLDVLASHGYERVSPPLVEYERSLASRMDGVKSENLLRFVDPLSQRTLAIRSDMTTQVGRIATTVLSDAPRPLRLSYAGPVLKLRAGQLRPEREMTQIGAELVGNDSVVAATEMVSVAIAALERAGVKGITVDFTLPDLIDVLASDQLPLESEKIDSVRTVLDAKDAGGLSDLGAEQYLPLIEATGPFRSALDALASFDDQGALSSRIEALRAIAGPIGDHINLTLDPTERHGFEYQSWFGFSIFAEGFVGALGRGGTYAVKCPDGSQELATGFSLYPDPLVDVGYGDIAKKRLFLPLGHSAADAEKLRQHGWQTVAALDENDEGKALACTHYLDGALATEY